MGGRIRAIIADGHELFRRGAVSALAAESDIEVSAEAVEMGDAIRLARELSPDVVLLDIGLPGALDAVRSICSACPAAHLIALALTEQQDHVLEVFRAGARAYLLKTASARELIAVVRAVHAGETYVPPQLARTLMLEATGVLPGQAPMTGALGVLTERERQILERVGAGYSNREIGQQLHLTEKTVKHYMTGILRKLGVRNRVEATLLLQQGGDRARHP